MLVSLMRSLVLVYADLVVTISGGRRFKLFCMNLISLLDMRPAYGTTKRLDFILFVSALSVIAKFLNESIRASFKS